MHTAFFLPPTTESSVLFFLASDQPAGVVLLGDGRTTFSSCIPPTVRVLGQDALPTISIILVAVLQGETRDFKLGAHVEMALPDEDNQDDSSATGVKNILGRNSLFCSLSRTTMRAGKCTVNSMDPLTFLASPYFRR